MLEELVAQEREILPVRRLSSNGLKAWAQAVHKGYEGLVGKDPESPYVGGRTLKWLKVKVPQYREGERGDDPAGRGRADRGYPERNDLSEHPHRELPGWGD